MAKNIGTASFENRKIYSFEYQQCKYTTPAAHIAFKTYIDDMSSFLMVDSFILIYR